MNETFGGREIIEKESVSGFKRQLDRLLRDIRDSQSIKLKFTGGLLSRPFLLHNLVFGLECSLLAVMGNAL